MLLSVGAALAQDATPAAGAESSGSAGATAPADSTPPAGEVTVPAAPPGKESSAATANGASVAAAPAAGSTAPSAGKGAEGQAAGGSAGASAGSQADTKGAANSSPFSTLASPSNGPIKIRSDSLSVDYKKNSALWRGHVHAVRADGELTSDTLQVFYGKDFHELQQMIASGNVRISRGTQWSLSDHAVLNEASQTVVLTGNPVVHDGNDQITGNKITVYLKTGESVVEGAKAVFFPRQGETHGETHDSGRKGQGADLPSPRENPR